MAAENVQIIITGTDKLSDVLDHIGDKSDGLGSKLAGIGTVALAGFAAVAGGIGVAVNAFADFEKTMSGVKAVSGATADELSGLNDLALKLGKDTVFSASEAAKGIEELLKGGLSIGDVMNGAAEATLNLATAGEVSLSEAAEIAANALAMFSLKGEDMAMVSNQIAGAAIASSLSVNDFRYSLASVGAVANMAGQSFEQTATAIAVLGKQGLKGSDAGTSLKTMLLNLQPATKAARAAFEGLGITAFDADRAMADLRAHGVQPLGKDMDTLSKQLMQAHGIWDGQSKITAKMRNDFDDLAHATGIVNNRFKDANGNFKDLSEIAGILHEGLKDLNEGDATALLKEAFGQDAVRAAAILGEQGAEGFNKMAESMNKVTAASVAKDKLDNLNGSIEMLKGSFETFLVIIGGKFAPAIREAVDGITGFLNAMMENQAVLDAIGAGADLVAAGLRNIGNAAGSLFGILTSTGGDRAGFFEQLGFDQESAEAAGAFLDEVQSKIENLHLFLTSGGTMRAVLLHNLGLDPETALRAADFFNMIERRLTDFTAFIGSIPTRLNDFRKSITAVWDSIGPGAQTFIVLTTAVVALAPAVIALHGALVILPAVLGLAALGFQGMAVSAAAAMIAAAPLVLIVGAIAIAVGLLGAAWVTNFGDIQGKTEAALAAVSEFWDAVSNMDFERAFSGLGTALATVGEAIGGAFSDLGTLISETLQGWATAFTDWAGDLWNSITAPITAFATSIVDWLVGTATSIVTALEEWTRPFRDWIGGLWNAVRIIATFFWREFSGWLTERATDLVTTLDGWTRPFRDWAGALWATVSGKLSEWWTNLTGWLGQTTTGVSTETGKWHTSMTEWASTAWATVSGALARFFSDLSSWFASVFTMIGTGVGGWVEAFTGWVGGIWTTVETGLNAFAGRMLGWLGEQAKTLGDEAKKIGEQIIGGFLAGLGAEKDKALKAVQDWGQEVIDTAHEKYEIESPSLVFQRIGEDVVAGFVVGIESGVDSAVGAVTALVNQVRDKWATDMKSAAVTAGAIAGAAYAQSYGDSAIKIGVKEQRRIRDAYEASAEAEAKAAKANAAYHAAEATVGEAYVAAANADAFAATVAGTKDFQAAERAAREAHQKWEAAKKTALSARDAADAATVAASRSLRKAGEVQQDIYDAAVEDAKKGAEKLEKQKEDNAKKEEAAHKKALADEERRLKEAKEQWEKEKKFLSEQANERSRIRATGMPGTFTPGTLNYGVPDDAVKGATTVTPAQRAVFAELGTEYARATGEGYTRTLPTLLKSGGLDRVGQELGETFGVSSGTKAAHAMASAYVTALGPGTDARRKMGGVAFEVGEETALQISAGARHGLGKLDPTEAFALPDARDPRYRAEAARRALEAREVWQRVWEESGVTATGRRRMGGVQGVDFLGGENASKEFGAGFVHGTATQSAVLGDGLTKTLTVAGTKAGDSSGKAAGEAFSEQFTESVKRAVAQFDPKSFNPLAARKHIDYSQYSDADLIRMGQPAGIAQPHETSLSPAQRAAIIKWLEERAAYIASGVGRAGQWQDNINSVNVASAPPNDPGVNPAGSLPNLRLASGGIVRDTTMAVLAETPSARPEVVSPLSTLLPMIEASVQRANGGSGGGSREIHIHVHGDMDLEMAARRLAREFGGEVSAQRRMGTAGGW